MNISNKEKKLIRQAVDWFIKNYKKNEPNNAFEVRYDGLPYVLKMTKEDKGRNDK